MNILQGYLNPDNAVWLFSLRHAAGAEQKGLAIILRWASDSCLGPGRSSFKKKFSIYLKTPSDEEYSISLSKLFQWLIIRTVKNSHLISNLILSSFSFPVLAL